MTLDEVVLFVDSEQLGDDAKKHLGDTVLLKPYEEIFDYLKGLQANASVNKDKVGLFLFLRGFVCVIILRSFIRLSNYYSETARA